MLNKKIITIIGGAIKKDASGIWRTTSYEDFGDKFGLDGCRLRVVAGSLLWRDNTNSLIIASGGTGQNKGIKGVPAVATVIAKELVSLGVPSKAIIKENKSGNTFEQLVNLQKMIDWSKIAMISIVSNGFHLPRIQSLIEFYPSLKELKLFLDSKQIEFCDADDILLRLDSKHWKNVIDRARGTQAYHDRLYLERKGVQDIKVGRYKF